MKKMKLFFLGACLTLSMCMVPAYADEAVQPDNSGVTVQNTAKKEVKSMKTSQLDHFSYVLCTPKEVTENMPLIVYLHGNGSTLEELENGDTVFEHLYKSASQKESAYVIAPFYENKYDDRSDPQKRKWYAIEPSVMELLEAVITEYQIDRTRVYLVGGSMGADAGIRFIANHPDVFAGMVGFVPFHYKCPIAAWDNVWGEAFKTVPTWIFVEDEKSAKEKAAAAETAIQNAGGQIWIEYYANMDHGQATKRFRAGMTSGEYAIYDWLLSLKKENQ